MIKHKKVTPYVGVWIETVLMLLLTPVVLVTPYVGVWIETALIFQILVLLCHTLRGCVD